MKTLEFSPLANADLYIAEIISCSRDLVSGTFVMASMPSSPPC